jgi:hypothetical protein
VRRRGEPHRGGVCALQAIPPARAERIRVPGQSGPLTAQQGPGNLLGNLLCAVANLLNNSSASPNALQQIANLLNQISPACRESSRRPAPSTRGGTTEPLFPNWHERNAADTSLLEVDVNSDAMGPSVVLGCYVSALCLVA